MCAGGTVWTVLSEYGVRSTDRVGIMGIGGLGHLAIKLAAAMGCHVVVFSSSEAKREEAFSFGASEYHVFKAGQELTDFKPVKISFSVAAPTSTILRKFLLPFVQN